MGCFMHAISLSYQSEPLIMTVSPACIQPTTLWLKQSTFVFAEYSYDKLLSNYCVLLIVSQFVLPSATEDYAITSSNLTFSATMPSQMVTIPNTLFFILSHSLLQEFDLFPLIFQHFSPKMA